MRFIVVAVCAALLISSSPAVAWNGRGHMMVASVAWRNLTPSMRERVTEILKLNPEYPKWIAGVSAAQRDEVAFMRASKWADDIKFRPGYSRDEADGPGAAGGRAYDDVLQHRYWHFKDKPFSVDGTPLEQPYGINAQTQIEAFREVLSANEPDAKKSYDLVWLLHLVGDVHQPLHAVTRFSGSPSTLIDGDRGGNEIKLRVCLACNESNLHSFWDNLLETDETPVSVSSAAAELTNMPDSLASNKNVGTWIEESFEQAKAFAYGAPIENGVGPYILTDEYVTFAKAIARKRVALAGARLAKLIGDNLK